MWALLSTVLLAFVSLSTGAAAVQVQKVTFTLRDFSYTPDRVTLQAGVPVEITIINKGKVTHEFMVHPKPKSGGGGMDFHEWAEANSYFRGLQVSVEGAGVEVERKGKNLVEVRIGPGKTAIVKFTPAKKGTFEYACLVTGHYEQGQRGTLTIQ